jgi:hypothetical protein
MARQKKKTNTTITAIIVAVFGIVLLFLGLRTFIGIHGKLLNISTCDESEISPGKYVEANFTIAYGRYVEKTTTYNYVVTTTNGYYYLVDACDQNEDGSQKDSARWIGVSIDKADDSAFNSLTYDDNPSPIHVKGVIRENNSQVQGYLEDYIRDYVDALYEYYGYTADDEAYDYFLEQAFPYYVESIDTSDYIINIGIGLLLLIIAAIIFVKAQKDKNNAALSQQAYGTSGAIDNHFDYGASNTPSDDYSDYINNSNYNGSYSDFTNNSNDNGSYSDFTNNSNDNGSYSDFTNNSNGNGSYSDSADNNDVSYNPGGFTLKK